jgi:hypothetical protein
LIQLDPAGSQSSRFEVFWSLGDCDEVREAEI